MSPCVTYYQYAGQFLGDKYVTAASLPCCQHQYVTWQAAYMMTQTLGATDLLLCVLLCLFQANAQTKADAWVQVIWRSTTPSHNAASQSQFQDEGG
jgi:hypothetical protein